MKIKGYVLDEFGIPLSGSHITKFGNPLIGTYTDKKGYFELENDSINSFDNFKVTYVGYGDKLVSVKELEQNPNINLVYQVNELDEFVGVSSPLKKQNKYKKPAIIIGAVAMVVSGFFILKKVM